MEVPLPHVPPGVVENGDAEQLLEPSEANGSGDIVRDFLAEVRRGAPHDARRYHEACELAFARKPATLQQSMDALELARLSNSQCKVMLSVMNVTGCKNSCLAAKKYILACKMVQRSVALQSLFDITSRLNLVQAHEQRADGGTPEDEVARIKSLPKTSACAEQTRPGQMLAESVAWSRGDIPVFVEDEVIVGEPPIDSLPATAIDGDTKSDLKRRPPTRRPSDTDDRIRQKRRYCSVSGPATGDTSVGHEADLSVKESEAQSASARAVSDTIKAIKEAEAMMTTCDEDDENGREFYKSVVSTLRQKMAAVVGLPLPRQ